MKKIYISMLACTALLLAGTATAQKSLNLRSPFSTISPAHSGGEVRGGGAPANDECTGAVNQDLAIGGTVVFTGDNTGATDGEGFGFGQAWEMFTTTECADITLTYCGTNPVFANAFLSLFVDCPYSSFISSASFDQTTCADGNVTIFYTTVPAGTYYYAVLTDPGVVEGPYTITVSAVAAALPCLPPPPPPANDDCDAAISLTANTWCNFQYFTGLGGTESLPGLDCNGFTGSADDDVWFSFVATAADMTIGVQGSDDGDGDVNTGYDAVVELFEGACPGTSINCADASLGNELEEIAATGLSVGATYYVRVYDWYATPWPDQTFGICVVEGTGGNIGIEESSSVDAWSIFPNPGTGVFNLQYTGASALSNIEVFDLTGRVVYNEQVSLAKGANHNIDLSDLSAGNYNVRLTANGARTEQRLMVK